MMSKYVLGTNMTLSELAKTAGVPYSTVQEYFSAKKDISKCSLGTFLKIATALNISMDALYSALSGKEKKKVQKYQGIKIPEEFRGSFWDRNFEELDLDKETDFIIARLFTHAGFYGAEFVETTFEREDIIHAIKTRRDFNKIVANYLQKRYKLDRSEMAYYTLVHDIGNDWR